MDTTVRITEVHDGFVLTDDGEAIETRTPVGGGPPIIEHVAFNGGRPVSVWDVVFDAAVNDKLKPGDHAINVGPGQFMRKSASVLHAEALARANRPLRFTLAEARRIKRSYWSGEKTITQLAREYGVTKVTVGRLVHGMTYWWA